MKLFWLLMAFGLGYHLFGQSGVLIKTYERNNPLTELVAHNDSSIFLINIKAYEKKKFDFYISRHQAFKKQVVFDTCLHIAKLFGGKLNANTFKYSIFQCNEHLLFVFDVYVGNHKKVIAKAINYNGRVSDAFVLDDSDLSNPELVECDYYYKLTDRKELLVTLRRKYKSGYQRDKCMLYNEYMSKLWDYELPKINYHYNVNVLATVYNSNQLIYRIENGFLDKNGNEWVIRNDYDTIVKKTVDGLQYDVKVPKDSLTLIIVNPLQKTVQQTNLYWPFKKQGMMVPVSSSQIILYDLVDIDDEKFVLPGKKAIYYKRIDIKNNKVLFEELIPLSRHIQENLTYQCGAGSNGPTSKHFNLSFQNIVDGKLISLFENTCFEECEVIVSSFNVSMNAFDWIYLFPRKISTSSQLHALTCSYTSNTVQMGFYENNLNFNTPLEQYRHNRHKMVRGYDDSQFVTWSIVNSGRPVKAIVNSDAEDFLFPWLKNRDDSSNKFFQSKDFLPIGFLYKVP